MSCDHCCVTFVSLFINLRHSRGFMPHTPRRRTLYYYVKAFFCTSAFLSLPAPGRFSCYRQGARPNTTAQVWALAEVRGTCSGGSKSHVRLGRDSEHVEPSRPLQTQVRIKRVSDGSCDIWDLGCHQCRQTIVTWRWKSFPRHQHARHATTFNAIR